MNISQLEYVLPKELIANSPISPRDHSRLMIVDRKTNQISHKHFFDLPDLLTSNDVLVFNQTKVFPARLIAQKETGGKIELLLIKELKQNIWSALVKGKVVVGQKLELTDATALVISKNDNEVEIEFNIPDFWEWLYAYGKIPLPPYISSHTDERELRNQYQTVYANQSGSVAAPTAGLHFTQDLLEKIKNKGIQTEFVTLHVGTGTFLPIKVSDLSKHAMHTEHFSIDVDTAARLNKAKKESKRIISVGTTSTRVLETCANTSKNKLSATTGETNIFIYPPYKFKYVDCLITNFHLPHSTLLALVSAFVSIPNTQEEFVDFQSSLMGKAYKEAIQNKYRFYSFGDASIIL